MYFNKYYILSNVNSQDYEYIQNINFVKLITHVELIFFHLCI